jgi:hypothetical protein
MKLVSCVPLVRDAVHTVTGNELRVCDHWLRAHIFHCCESCCEVTLLSHRGSVTGSSLQLDCALDDDDDDDDDDKGDEYESRLKSSEAHLITPSRNFVEVR